MAARALKKIDFAPIMTYLVATGQTTTKGLPVIFSGSEEAIATNASTPDAVIGIALETKTAGLECQVALFGPVIPMVVGTGGSTYGVKQQFVSDGVTDAAAHDSSGAVDDFIVGIAMQSGSAADLIGVQVLPCNRGAAS
jgi:hypothetical protein